MYMRDVWGHERICMIYPKGLEWSPHPKKHELIHSNFRLEHCLESVISFKALVEPLTKVTFATDGGKHWTLSLMTSWPRRGKMLRGQQGTNMLLQHMGALFRIRYCLFRVSVCIGWGSAYFMWCWVWKVLKMELCWSLSACCFGIGLCCWLPVVNSTREKVYTLWTCRWVCCWRARFQPLFLSSNTLPVEIRFCKPHQTNTGKRIFALHRAQEVLCILSKLSAAPSRHSAKHLLWTPHPRM